MLDEHLSATMLAADKAAHEPPAQHLTLCPHAVLSRMMRRLGAGAPNWLYKYGAPTLIVEPEATLPVRQPGKRSQRCDDGSADRAVSLKCESS